MNRTRRSGRTAGFLFGVSLFVLLPLSAAAFWAGFPFGGGGMPGINMDKFPATLCPSTISTGWLSVPVFLPCEPEPEPPPPPPPPTDVCPNVPGDQATGPCADQECVEDGGTWDGDSCEFPPPPPPEPALDFTAGAGTINEGATTTLSWDSTNTTFCTASNGWSGSRNLDGSEIVGPTATTTYTLTCSGDGGDVAKSVTVNVILAPEPEPEGKLLITEVLYDLGPEQGSEPSNEWVEIYNGTNAQVDLTGYSITNNNGSDILPGTVIVPADTYLLIIATGSSTSTLEFWDVPATAVVVTLPNATIGGGLTNTNGWVLLANVASTTIDMVAWGETGTTTEGFGEVVPDVAAGHSIARNPVTVDTDTNADWIDRETPTPGE